MGVDTGALNVPKYDDYGRLISYTEKETDVYGVTRIKNWLDGVYDNFGQVLSIQRRISTTKLMLRQKFGRMRV
jgi:hypothetical protein